MDRDDISGKFLQIETAAKMGKHLVERWDKEKIILTCRCIRRDLEELEIEFGRRTNDASGSQG